MVAKYKREYEFFLCFNVKMMHLGDFDDLGACLERLLICVREMSVFIDRPI